MKAMILAAGFGTRLMPFTKNIPKPLFTVSGRPLLDMLIRNLERAGCSEIIINTHHLHERIKMFLETQTYSIPVFLRYEPVILGTGGAVKNVSDFWDGHPFFVINSDIITDISLEEVYTFHLNHSNPVTMVLCDDPELNSVVVRPDGFIVGFDFAETKKGADNSKKLTFTGIQVLDPEVLEFIPRGTFSSIIDAYRNVLASGKTIRMFFAQGGYWKDIGSPKRYKEASFDIMAPVAFHSARAVCPSGKIRSARLTGDGSDREWYRLIQESEPEKTAAVESTGTQSQDIRTLIMVDHGIRMHQKTSDVDAYVNIGRHLHEKGVPVPEIYSFDTVSGLVFLEDLGDIHLQEMVRNSTDLNEIVSWYASVIDLLIQMSISGAEGFNPSWASQTSRYDRGLILEKECRYFVDSFLRHFCGMDVCFENFEDEFFFLANKALESATEGFMHRDMQSRNIMFKSGRFYFIDFQGGRIGPVQYDLASLLIDPYVELPMAVQQDLLTYGVEKFLSFSAVKENSFRTCYDYCSITRNLQILGAFAHLSRYQGKPYFEAYISPALGSLTRSLSACGRNAFPKLSSIVEQSNRHVVKQGHLQESWCDSKGIQGKCFEKEPRYP